MVHSLRAEELSKSFKGRTVVSSVTFSVGAGEVVGLLGPNGAGKTTSFYMVVGLLFPQSGRVYLGEKDITSLPMYVRARMGISYLPQSVSIFRKLTVRENLLAIMQIVNLSDSEQDEYIEELLEKFQIKHIEHSMGLALSGGERRRVEIARALIIKPKFLLLDEPFAGVDPVTVQEIQMIIAQLRSEGLGILITDHNVRETLSSCNRAYVLSDGKVIAQGNPEEISTSAIVKDIYLGQKFKL
jgi:lipopolysaccharide export system ATP-binding protein